MRRSTLSLLAASIAALSHNVISGTHQSARDASNLEGIQLAAPEASQKVTFRVEIAGISSLDPRTVKIVANNPLLPGNSGDVRVQIMTPFDTTGFAALRTWYFDVVSSGNLEPRSMSVITLGATGEEISRFNAFDCLPSKWQYAPRVPAGSDTGGILEEVVVLECEQLEPS